MADVLDKDLYILLRRGDEVQCPNCKEGKIVPYNTTCDKAHGFYCNRECGFYIIYDPILDIE